MTPFVFRVLHVSTWIHFGADRTPPFDISEKGVIRFCVSSNAFAVHCHFDVKYYLHSTTYFPLPPSHTTYSVVKDDTHKSRTISSGMCTDQCMSPVVFGRSRNNW